MKRSEVQKLQPGDEVYWNDPDEGICSKYITIREIAVTGDVVLIKGQDGSSLECFADELS